MMALVSCDMYTSMLFRWKLYDLLCIGGGKLCIAEVLLINRNPQELLKAHICQGLVRICIGICLELKAIFRPLVSLRHSECLVKQHLNNILNMSIFNSECQSDTKGIKRGLHFITNLVFRQCHVHIKVSLHQLIKWLDYFFMEYHILVFLIGEHQNWPNLKHIFAYFHFQLFHI